MISRSVRPINIWLLRSQTVISLFLALTTFAGGWLKALLRIRCPAFRFQLRRELNRTIAGNAKRIPIRGTKVLRQENDLTNVICVVH